jgi:hypothetical protein
LLKHKQKLQKLWQDTRVPARKTAVNWVLKAIRRMTRKKTLQWWETKIGNAEVNAQATWPIAKSILKRDGPRPQSAIHGSSGLKFQAYDRSSV